MTQETFTLQENKELSNCKTAYIFKGLGRNLIPFSPNDEQLAKMKANIVETLSNNGKSYDKDSVDAIIGSSPKIGLELTYYERKFIEVLATSIANTTLWNLIQRNIHFNKKRWSNKVESINYENIQFKIPIKEINKLFGRSINEKNGKNKINIVKQLSSKKYFLINHKGEIKYQKAFPMAIIGDYLKFKFHSFLIGRGYDKRKDFFDIAKTHYETIFFEYLFGKTKNFRKEAIDHLCFSTNNLLKKLSMEEHARTHKQKTIQILNTCFSKAYNIGIFTEIFQYASENFDRHSKEHINIPINTEFKWY